MQTKLSTSLIITLTLMLLFISIATATQLSENQDVFSAAGELTQEDATQLAVDFLTSKGAQYLDRADIESIMEEDANGSRTWSVTFRPNQEGMPYGGACNMTVTATGEIITYSLPSLVPLMITGTAPDAGAISEEDALATGKNLIAAQLNIPEADLTGVAAFFGYIDIDDEQIAHAKWLAHVWAITTGQGVYALLTPTGETLFVGSIH